MSEKSTDSAVKCGPQCGNRRFARVRLRSAGVYIPHKRVTEIRARAAKIYALCHLAGRNFRDSLSRGYGNVVRLRHVTNQQGFSRAQAWYEICEDHRYSLRRAGGAFELLLDQLLTADIRAGLFPARFFFLSCLFVVR